jgi:hypothetical protein
MDHQYINEFDLVERYSMGRLTAEETAEFEEHFVDCAHCIDRLETTKAFVGGLRLAASEQAPQQLSSDPSKLFRYLGNATGTRKMLALAAGLLLVILAGAIAYNQIRRASVEADQARDASTQWESRFEQQRESSSVAERKHEESERMLTEQIAQLRTELNDERKQKLTNRLNETGGPKEAQINVPILVLSSARGSEPSSGGTNELVLTSSTGSFVISLSLEGDEPYKGYRMTILNSDKHVIWKRGGFRPNRDSALSVSFPSTLFRPGDYQLDLEGIAGNGKTGVVGKYSFRVLRNL